MGGYGSGRPSNFPTTVESSQRIDMRFLKKKGWLKPGYIYTLNWTCRGQPSGSIHYRAESDYLVLMYRYRRGEGEWQDVEQRIGLASTPCNYGGHRQWLVCPRCSRRCVVLCSAGKLFLCRKCYGLPYQTQLENEHGRACIKRNNLHEKLWGANRPRMWNKTRERLYYQFLEAEQTANRALAIYAEKLGM